MFRAWREVRRADRIVRTAFTARHGGGASGPPFDDLNLAEHVGDDPAAVAANRAAIAAALGVGAIAWMNQVHGSDVAVIGPDGGGPRPQDPPGDPAGGVAAGWPALPRVDGLVTGTPGVGVGVLVADCVPVLLVSQRGAVGAVHAGRRGVQAQIVLRALEALERIDGSPVWALVGPAVCGGCYEVPQQMQDEVCDVVPQARTTTRRGTPGLDLRAAVARQLRRREVRVEVLGGGGSALCTVEDPGLFSYRRDGRTGRFAGVAVCLPA